MRSSLVLPFIAAALCLCSARAQDLKLGDPAPKLDVAKWVKGDPVKEFEKDKVYVVEFWATWCGPCRVSIPHLTELQKKYADKGVIMIGQDLGETEDKVAKFVADMGDKMDYRVALEADGVMGKTWFRAAGQSGIPCAFIVDKAGKIAWIGHPMTMDEPLAKIVAGEWDIAQAAEQHKKEMELREKRMQASRALGQARQAKDWKKVIELIDAAVKEEPRMERAMGPLKLDALFELEDYDAAYAMVAKLAEANKGVPMALNQLAWMILDKPGLKKRDLDLAVKLAGQANEAAGGKDASIIDTLARAHFDKGDVDQAIKLQKQAIEVARDEMKANLQKTLEKYQAKKSQ